MKNINKQLIKAFILLLSGYMLHASDFMEATQMPFKMGICQFIYSLFCNILVYTYFVSLYLFFKNQSLEIELVNIMPTNTTGFTVQLLRLLTKSAQKTSTVIVFKKGDECTRWTVKIALCSIKSIRLLVSSVTDKCLQKNYC